MRPRWPAVLASLALAVVLPAPTEVTAQRPEVRAWVEEVEIPTYPLGEADPNPRFRAIEGDRIYPYSVQDRFGREPIRRRYRGVWLENRYLRVLCLPELGGRIVSVYDKVADREMFYRNHVVRPGHIALRGAWISGGIEWNRGPEGHGVTSFSPVDVRLTGGEDGSASLLIGGIEQVTRTGWQVRLTLHPGRRLLDERILLYNPTDGIHPYYFWNNTAFPETDRTRFIFPMTLGTDHDGGRFFAWPVHEGRDMTRLRNYPEPTSVFGYRVEQDFFGAYDVGAGYGIVQVADHHRLPGKKAWTWGTADAGRVAQSVLTDGDGPYIEVQSGPLRTQSDFAMLMPGQEVSWQEYWYPVSGLAEGFEYATRHAAIERIPYDDGVELRIAATGTYPNAQLVIRRVDGTVVRRPIELTPERTETVRIDRGPRIEPGELRLGVTLLSGRGTVLLDYESPLRPEPVAAPVDSAVTPPDTAGARVREGWQHDLGGDRLAAMHAYRSALELDPGDADALRWLAADELERGRAEEALALLDRALERRPDDGWSHYLRGVAHLRAERLAEAEDDGFAALRQAETVALGWSLVGRARARRGNPVGAVDAFTSALSAGGAGWTRLFDQVIAATWAAGDPNGASAIAREAASSGTLRLIPHLLPALSSPDALDQAAAAARDWLGEPDFSFMEASLTLADLGLTGAAANLLEAGAVRSVEPDARRPEPLWLLAWYRQRTGDEVASDSWLAEAADSDAEHVFPSRVEMLPVLEWVTARRADDALAWEALGNLHAGLDRLDDAASAWRRAAELDPRRSVARRNLAMLAWKVEGDLEAAERWLRAAVAARPSDSTLFRDLARLLRERGEGDEAIELLEGQLRGPAPRTDLVLELADAWLEAGRPDETLRLLEGAHFVNREGDRGPWDLFHVAHLARGDAMLADDPAAALDHFDAALTYPANLNAGRPHRPREARAWLGRGRALRALGREEEALESFARCLEMEPLDEPQRTAIEACRAALPGV